MHDCRHACLHAGALITLNIRHSKLLQSIINYSHRPIMRYHVFYNVSLYVYKYKHIIKILHIYTSNTLIQLFAYVSLRYKAVAVYHLQFF